MITLLQKIIITNHTMQIEGLLIIYYPLIIIKCAIKE